MGDQSGSVRIWDLVKNQREGGDRPAHGTIGDLIFTPDKQFLITGGDHPMSQSNPTAVNLLINRQVVDTATGNNSADMDWVSWDVSKYKGQQATIQVVDQNDGSSGWGHIILDDIVFSPLAAAPMRWAP